MKRVKTEQQLLAEAEQTKINRLYADLLGKDAGTEIVDDLVKHFELRSMIKKDRDGRFDEFMTAAACGAYDMISYIKQRINNGQMAR